MDIKSILANISREETVSLLKDMIRIDTVNPPGNEKVLAEKIKEKFDQLGISSEVVDLGHDRANVIGVIKGTGERKALL